jgi:hypothetical protein
MISTLSLQFPRRKRLSEVIDDALRLTFVRPTSDAESARPFRLPSHGSGGLRPGVDLEDREALAEILGDNEQLLDPSA